MQAAHRHVWSTVVAVIGLGDEDIRLGLISISEHIHMGQLCLDIVVIE